MSKQTVQATPEFDADRWCASNKEFVQWWSNHRHSGFCMGRNHKWRWGIPPWQAFSIERYRAEYEGTSQRYSREEIAVMKADQSVAENAPEEFHAKSYSEAAAIIQACMDFMAWRLGGKKLPAWVEKNPPDCAEDYILHRIRSQQGAAFSAPL